MVRHKTDLAEKNVKKKNRVVPKQTEAKETYCRLEAKETYYSVKRDLL